MKTVAKAIPLFIMIFIAAALTVYGQNNAGEKTYSVKKLKKDFQYTKCQLQKLHPGLYWYVEKETFEACYDSLYKTIDQPLTEIAFHNKLLPLFHMIREKHNNIYLSNKGYDRLRYRAKTFPFSVKEIDNKLFIYKNGSLDTSLIKGTEILEINGRSSESIIDAIKKQMVSDGYNTTSILRYEIEGWFWYSYHLVIDQGVSFDLLVKKTGSDIPEHARVTGVTRKEFSEKTNDIKSAKKYPLQFNIIDSLNTAVFTIDDFASKKRNSELHLDNFHFMSYVFDQLNHKPHIKNLIIDVRQNGGGNPGMEISILSFLTEARDKVYKRIERNRWGFFFKKDSTGKYYSDKMLGYTLKPKPDHFTGQIYLLTGGKTYSAASLFSASVASFTNAIVVGEETGGGYYGGTGGSFKKAHTPNVKIRLIIPKIWFRTNVTGQPKGTGLLPDYQVTQTYDDFVNDRDTEMLFTLKLISKSHLILPSN